MTDFLTRLAERALGLALVVQPILMPLYAPEQYQGDGEQLDLLPVEEPAAQEPTTASSPHFPSERGFLEMERGEKGSLEGESGVDKWSGHLHRPEGEMVRSREEGDASVPIPLKPLSAPTGKRDRQKGEEVGGSDHIDGTRATQASKVPAPLSTQSPPLRESAMGETVRELAAQEVSASGIGTEYPSLPLLSERGRQREEIPTSVPMPLAEPRTVFVEAPARALPGKKAIQPQMMPASDKKRPTVPEAPVSQPEVTPPATPTVHVTIGRIEVRATPPPASTVQAQRQKPAPKVMSLDDYLHQQAKGGC